MGDGNVSDGFYEENSCEMLFCEMKWSLWNELVWVNSIQNRLNRNEMSTITLWDKFNACFIVSADFFCLWPVFDNRNHFLSWPTSSSTFFNIWNKLFGYFSIHTNGKTFFYVCTTVLHSSRTYWRLHEIDEPMVVVSVLETFTFLLHTQQLTYLQVE